MGKMGLIIFMIVMRVQQAVSPEQRLYEYGVLGIVLVIVSIFAYKLFNIILTDRDKAISQRDVLLEDFFTKIIPALTKNTEVLQTRQDLDREIINLIKDFDSGVGENNRVLQEIKIMLSLGLGNAQTGGSQSAPNR